MCAGDDFGTRGIIKAVRGMHQKMCSLIANEAHGTGIPGQNCCFSPGTAHGATHNTLSNFVSHADPHCIAARLKLHSYWLPVLSRFLFFCPWTRRSNSQNVFLFVPPSAWAATLPIGALRNGQHLNDRADYDIMTT